MDMDLKGIAEKGYVRLSIKTEDTVENLEVIEHFKTLARGMYKNDYTVTLRELMKNFDDDYRFAALWEHIEMVRSQLAAIEAKLEKPKVEEKTDGVF